MTPPSHLALPNVPLSRAWNSWSAGRPLEMRFLPLGIRVTPLVFAASLGKVSLFKPGDLTLGVHHVDGGRITARLAHGGTELDWSWDKSSPFDLMGGWRTVGFGEWGLRVWVILALSGSEGTEWSYDAAAGTAHFSHGPRRVVIQAERPPLLVTGHASLDDLVREFETHGYWYLGSRSDAAPLIALRFNLEEAAQNRFAVAIADRRDLPVGRAASLLSDVAKADEQDPVDDPVAAVRDIMGWNSIYDDSNHRPYITCSRNWDLWKFGGFGFWLNDTAINALLVALFDPEQSRENLGLLLAGATPEGNLPCILTGNDQWVDRTQSPIVSLVVWQLWLRAGDRSLLATAWPVLAANNDWLFRARDGNGNGILEFGSSPVGQGLYRGTKLAAKDESFMDNSPIHDEARWVSETNTLDCEDVGLNALACLDCEMLGRIGRVLGLAEAARYETRAKVLRERIAKHFWDPERQIFANRLWSGRFVRSLAPTSFYPLLCGAVDAERVGPLLAHLDDPQMFGGRFGLPSVAHSDAAYRDNVYWRGRIWPILNWLVWLGLRRAGADEAARRLVDKGEALFFQSWRERRLCPENYNAETGDGLDQPDTDPFYSWSALLPYMAAAEIMDFSPFDGWTIINRRVDARLSPVMTPLGPVAAECRQGVLILSRHGEPFLETDVPGRLTELQFGDRLVECMLPAGVKAGAELRFRHIATPLDCRQAGRALTVESADGWCRVTLAPTGNSRQPLRVLLS